MRILLVEDEKAIADIVQKNLEREFFVVDTARDGEEGSFMAKTNKYDLLILDNFLPGVSGREICRETRAKGISTPIMIISVGAETSTKVELLNAGADDYLVKPFSMNELLARTRALLRRPKSIEQEILKISDLTLNAKKHVVARGGDEIRLARKEFMLLEYLMKNAGTVLSRGMLLDNVWDMNADPFSNTIESHILSLRRKIDSHKRQKLIYTVPGMGYKIEFKK
ncbi:MAG: response regulator transcription factor [bacterium]